MVEKPLAEMDGMYQEAAEKGWWCHGRKAVGPCGWKVSDCPGEEPQFEPGELCGVVFKTSVFASFAIIDIAVVGSGQAATAEDWGTLAAAAGPVGTPGVASVGGEQRWFHRVIALQLSGQARVSVKRDIKLGDLVLATGVFVLGSEPERLAASDTVKVLKMRCWDARAVRPSLELHIERCTGHIR